MPGPNDVAAYYDSTLNHYRRWWNLSRSLSLHFGIWNKNTRNLSEALINTNQVLMKLASISSSDFVLDAGCGVGGAAFQVHAETGARVLGITLSRKHLEMAESHNNPENNVSFQLMDYTQMTLESNTFDVVWACESVCHSENKSEFLREAFRVLKKNGRLVISDFFLAQENQHDPKTLIRKWCELWSIPGLESIESFKEKCSNNGFRNIESIDNTRGITKSSRKLYQASLLGSLPSELYNLLNPKVNRFARKHYLSGIYQYKALKKNLWRYMMLRAFK